MQFKVGKELFSIRTPESGDILFNKNASAFSELVENFVSAYLCLTTPATVNVPCSWPWHALALQPTEIHHEDSSLHWAGVAPTENMHLLHILSDPCGIAALSKVSIRGRGGSVPNMAPLVSDLCIVRGCHWESLPAILCVSSYLTLCFLFNMDMFCVSFLTLGYFVFPLLHWHILCFLFNT